MRDVHAEPRFDGDRDGAADDRARRRRDPLRLNVAITCYLLSLAVFIPISGWIADRFGPRRVFSAAIVVFTLGSIGCGLRQIAADAGGLRASSRGWAAR